MTCIPAQPNKASSTWGEAYGLLSFQVTGVLLASLLSYATSVHGGIATNVVMTVLFSALYVQFVEARVPGALLKGRYRLSIALRATMLLSVLSVGVSLFYDGLRAIEEGIVGMILARVLVGVVVSLLSVLIGLEIGWRFARWRRLRVSTEEKVQ